VLSKEEA
jgi:hypothetical protein